QPRGLSTLFFTELWERLSYYGMRAILVLYMVNEVNGMALDAKTAGAIYGLYTAGVYFFALPAGWIADRLMGKRKAVLVGGILIALGHFAMALPVTAGFFGGLLLIMVGTGFLKPNVSAIVGDLYPEGGGRRDAGFSIFYTGINIGAFLGPLICGYLGQKVDWHLGFGAAGVGMVLGVIQYVIGDKHLGDAGVLETTPEAYDQAKKQLATWGGLGAAIVGVITALHLSGVVTLTLIGVAQAMGGLIIGLAAVYFAYVLLVMKLEPIEKKRVGLIALLFVASAIFWSGFEQAGSSLNIFAEDLTDRTLLGWDMPASWLQAVNPMFIILLAPVFGALWVKLGSRNPSIPMKFGLGLTGLGLGFGVLAWGAAYTEGADPQKVAMTWLVVTYFLHTCGELCLSPVGLSTVTKLAPRQLVGQMMGVWFMATSLGNLIAGLVAGQTQDVAMSALFQQVFLVTGGAGLFFLLLSKPFNKLAGGIK
ncbi:MAG: peptide MFS transporter, partial [Acidobacteriota bacterium]